MGGSLTEEEDKRKRIIQGILKKLISDEVAQYPRAKSLYQTFLSALETDDSSQNKGSVKTRGN